MNKIEEKLIINESSDSMLLINALDNFYHESNMLFNNIYLSQTIFNQQKNNVFPLSFDKYDASWYKNVLVSAEMLIDRFHFELDNSKDYTYLFDNVANFDFLSFAKRWNIINYVVKFNLDENMWKVKSAEWKISQTTIWLNELLALNIKFDKNQFDEISFDTNLYEPLADAIGRNGFEEIINYIKDANNKKEDKKIKQDVASTTPVQPVELKPEKEVDPNSPEGVEIEMGQLIEWILLKQANIRAKNAVERPEQKEISPVRKVMTELIAWCDSKQAVIDKYLNIEKYGFDPYEYMNIIHDLNKVKELRKELNAKVDSCLEFATNNDPDVRLKPTKQIHRKYYKHVKLEEESVLLPADKELIKKLEKLNKELKITTKETKNEIIALADEIESLNVLLSDEDKINIKEELGEDSKEMQKISKEGFSVIDERIEEENDKEEVAEKQKDNDLEKLMNSDEVNALSNSKIKNKNVSDLGNEKIKLIDDEIKKVNKIIASNKKAMKNKQDLPISKVKDEMDQLLIWMSLKLKECEGLLHDYGYELNWKDNYDYTIEELNTKNNKPTKQENKKTNSSLVVAKNNTKKNNTKLMVKNNNNMSSSKTKKTEAIRAKKIKK